MAERAFKLEDFVLSPQQMARQEQKAALVRFSNRFYRAANKFHTWDLNRDACVAALTRADDHCEKCGGFGPEQYCNRFDIHHLTYDSDTEIPEDIVVLCRQCHDLMPRNGWPENQGQRYAFPTATLFREYFKAEREAGIKRYIEVDCKNADYGWPLRYLEMKYVCWCEGVGGRRLTTTELQQVRLAVKRRKQQGDAYYY